MDPRCNCSNCRRARRAQASPVDTGFSGWVVLRGLVEELLCTDDPSDALKCLDRMCGHYAFDEAGEALVRYPGAVEALLEHVQGDYLYEEDDITVRDLAVAILAACVRADPEECGPAAQGDLALPLVDVLVQHITANHARDPPVHHENATLALLAVAECPHWAKAADDDDDDEYTWGEDGMPQRRRKRPDTDDDDNFALYVAAPLAAVLKCGDGDAQQDALQTLTSIRLEARGGPQSYPGRSAGRRDCSKRVACLVDANIIEPLALILKAGHGDASGAPDDELEQDDTVLFALAAQCCTRLLSDSKPAFRPFVEAGIAAPLAGAVVAFANVEDDDLDVFVHACDAAGQLCGLTMLQTAQTDDAGNFPQKRTDDDGVLEAFLDAGAVEACVVALARPEEERRNAAVALLSDFCYFGDGAARVARAAGGVDRFVVMLAEDPDNDPTDYTEPNMLFSAAARVVAGLATDSNERAEALVAAGAVHPLKRAVVDTVRYMYSDVIHTASNRRRESFLRAAIAANALGNIAEHAPAPRRRGGKQRTPNRALRVASNEEEEPYDADNDNKGFVEALVFILRLRYPRYAQSPFREALAELKTAVAWCLASLCAHAEARQIVYDHHAVKPLVSLLIDEEGDAAHVHDFAYPGKRHSFREYAAMALHRLAGLSAAARKEVATPGVVSILREFVAAADPGTAAVGRSALSGLGLSAPTRTIPRRKCRRLG